MSHYTVTARVSDERLARHGDDLKAALDEMLEPWNKNTKDRKHLVFRDEEDEKLRDHQTKDLEYVRVPPEGNLLSKWDERFRVPGKLWTTFTSHRVPEDCKLVQIPARLVYPDFEDYMRYYCGYAKGRDPETGRYGYWSNPNGYWDWWVVGGRWTGFYPLRQGVFPRLGEPGTLTSPATAGRGDVVRLGDIDMDAVREQTVANAERFWSEWQELLEGKDFRYPDGPRGLALDLGFLQVVDGPLPADLSGKRAIPWKQKPCFVGSTHDVCTLLSRDDVMVRYLGAFSPVITFASMDDDGWYAPEEKGWFGARRDAEGERLKYRLAFEERYLHGHDDTLVLLDLHT